MLDEQFGDRLLRLRVEHGLTQDKFVEEMNKKFPKAKLNKSMVSKYENNVHKPQRFSLVQEIADFYGVTTDFLMCRTDDRYKRIGNEDCKRLKILGVIAAGIPILAQEDVLGYEYVPADFHADFCLKVRGDSMIGARILDGDIVYIRQQPDVENGEIAVVIIDNEEATLKRVYKHGGFITLRPENPNYLEKIYYKKDKIKISILGKAVFFKSEVR